MKQLLTIFIVAISQVCYSQKQIALKDAAKHVGETVKVCGKIYVSRFVSTAEGTPTFLNMGANYPNQLLTVVIWPDVRDSLKGAPEKKFLGKEICVIGKVELYRGKPEIVIRSPSQLPSLAAKVAPNGVKKR